MNPDVHQDSATHALCIRGPAAWLPHTGGVGKEI
jgi:hypothetical protein